MSKVFDIVLHLIQQTELPTKLKRHMKTDIDNNEAETNAKLIAEAGTVTNECGLTPRQLLDQRNELLGTLIKLRDDNSINIYGSQWTEIDQLIKKATE